MLDEKGSVIQRFSSESGGQRTETGQAMRAPTTVTSGTARLAKSAGMHRFRWDMAHPGPWSESGDGGGGPLAVPGTYRVRLTANDTSLTQPLRLRIDPRIAEDGVTVADLEAQLELNLQIRDAISEARKAAAELLAAQKNVEKALEAGEITDADAQDVRERLGNFRAALVASEEGSYPQPMLIGQLEYLYRMTTRADQKLGQDAFDRFKELRGQLDRFLQKLEQTGTDVLREAG